MPYGEPQVKTISGSMVVLILGITAMLLTAVVVLALANKDVGTIFGAVGAVIIGVGAAFGWNIHQQLGQVKEQANGRMTDILNQNKELQSQVTALALRIHPPGPDGTTTVTTTTKTEP